MVEPEIDVGEVEWTTRTPATFVLKNQCDHPIRILSIDASCACAVPDRERLTGSEVAAGGTLSVPVVFEAKADSGPKEYMLELRTNVGVSHGVIRGVVIPEWSLAESQIDLGFIDATQSAAARVRVKLSPPRSTRVVRAAARDGWASFGKISRLSETEVEIAFLIASSQLRSGAN